MTDDPMTSSATNAAPGTPIYDDDGIPRPLIVVDVQCGFLNSYTEHIPGRIVRLLERQEHDPVFFVRFENQPDSPFAQLLDWHGCSERPETDIAPELEPFVTPARVFSKPGQVGLPDSLASRLRQLDIKRVTVVGVDTDMCVLKVAMDLFDLGIEPVLLTDCCASTSGLQAHLAGLAVLSRNIGARRLREAGLSEGYLAAPPR